MRWAGYKCTRVRLNAEIMDHRYYQFKSDYEEQITLIKVHFVGSLLDLGLFYVSFSGYLESSRKLTLESRRICRLSEVHVYSTCTCR